MKRAALLVRRSAPRVLVLYKRSAYERYGNLSRVRHLLRHRDESVGRLREAHDAHHRGLELAKAALRALGARAKFRERTARSANVRSVDLVVSLGGDGTLLAASHLVGDGIPVIGINTAPRDSVGFFCAGAAQDADDLLASALAGKLRTTSVARMRVAIDGQIVDTRVLNDALVCHRVPAETSRYVLHVDGATEEHKSSGLWVGPPAGSTAAQRSAGGRVLPIRARAIQYVVREPYAAPGSRYRYTRGEVAAGDELVVVSKMVDARLYLDGARKRHRLVLGSRATFDVSPEPLTILGLRRR